MPSRDVGQAAGATNAVEAVYTGDWVCQVFRPGYNIRPPSADASQPLTNHMTTPSSPSSLPKMDRCTSCCWRVP